MQPRLFYELVLFDFGYHRFSPPARRLRRISCARKRVEFIVGDVTDQMRSYDGDALPFACRSAATRGKRGFPLLPWSNDDAYRPIGSF